MPDERAAGVILFRERPDHREYLLIKNPGGHWGFPKGRIEPGEDEAVTALREVGEEVGITHVQMIPGFQVRESYTFLRRGQVVNKEVVLFLASSPEDGRPGAAEVEALEWFPFTLALDRLVYPEQRRALRRAEEFLANLAQGA